MLANETIFTHWGIKVLESKMLSERAVLLQANDGSEWIMKRKMGLNAAKKELTLLHFLNQQKINAPVPIPSKSGEYIFEREQEQYCLYSYLHGKVFSMEESLSFPHLFGKQLADLHKVLDEKKLEVGFIEKDLYQMVYGWAVKKIDEVDGHGCSQLKSIYNEMEIDFKKKVSSLKRQVIHRDAHFKNMIHINEQEMGILDFEIAEVNVRIFDLCYCATSVLNEIFYDEGLRDQWILFVEKLVASYHQDNPLSQLEYDSLGYVMLSIQSIFMAYFAHIPHLYQINKEMFLWIYEKKNLFNW
ncbi:hypothetical protein J6TS2_22730 [Heyndrickxia sporothermodurans]|nr:hypothetical protein J6TS2_22730 [Heyndrickxia sporothermodurans]